MAMDRAPSGDRASDELRSRARGMDRRHAEPERRLGCLRCRQRFLSQPHSLRRPWRVARSADRTSRRAACRCWRSSARRAANSAAVQRAIDYLRRTQLPDGSWYGRWGMNYIYGTWSVLCALNAAGVDHGAPEMRRAVDWLLAIQKRRRRLGRGRRKLQARLPRLRARAEHRLADRLGAARPDGRRRGRSSGRGARHRLSPRAARAPTASGRSRATPRPASRASSTCATTATRNSSRSGRWRATAISRAADTPAVAFGM